MKKLTRKQINALTQGKKHWTEKRSHIVKLLKNFQIEISDENLEYFMEVTVPERLRQIEQQDYQDQISGRRKTNITPTDVKGTFDKVTNPEIGLNYHLSWAYSGAIFRLKRIEGDYVYLDNPKYKRKTLLKAKLEDLRETRNRTLKNTI